MKKLNIGGGILYSLDGQFLTEEDCGITHIFNLKHLCGMKYGVDNCLYLFFTDKQKLGLYFKTESETKQAVALILEAAKG